MQASDTNGLTIYFHLFHYKGNAMPSNTKNKAVMLAVFYIYNVELPVCYIVIAMHYLLVENEGGLQVFKYLMPTNGP